MSDDLTRAEAAVTNLRDRDDRVFAMRKLAQAWWSLALDFEKRRVRKEELDQRALRLLTVTQQLEKDLRAP
jgi:hypothetical protein